MRRVYLAVLAAGALAAAACQDTQQPVGPNARKHTGTFQATAIADQNAELSGKSRNERVDGQWTIVLTDAHHGYEILLTAGGHDRPYAGIYPFHSFGAQVTVTSDSGSTVYGRLSAGHLDLTDSDSTGVEGSFTLTASDTTQGSPHLIILGGSFSVPCVVGCDVPQLRRGEH